MKSVQILESELALVLGKGQGLGSGLGFARRRLTASLLGLEFRKGFWCWGTVAFDSVSAVR